MSMEQLLSTLDGALKDATIGLSTAVIDVGGGDSAVRHEFSFVKWALSESSPNLRPAALPSVMIRPRRWAPNGKRSDLGHRDAEAQIDVGYEFIGTDLLVIQKNVAVVATALAQVIDQLRAYSDATGGTVIEVADPIDYSFGQYPGAMSHGFIATITLTERSTQ